MSNVIPFPKVNKRTGESPLLSDCAGAFERYREIKREPKSAWDRLKNNLPWKPGGVM